jgi:glycerophosphoryl diester phosphodiesterase
MTLRTLCVCLALLALSPAARAARAAQTYTDAVKADHPAQYFSCDDGSAAPASPLLNKAATLSELAARQKEPIRLGDNATLEWWQLVPATDVAQPVFSTGDYQIGVRPLPKGKSNVTRCAFAATDQVKVVPGNPASTKAALFSQPSTLASAGKWFHVAMVQTGGKVQFYVNGYPAAAVLRNAPAKGELKLARDAKGATLVDEVAVYDHALAPERILAHFTAALPPRHIVTVGHRGDNRGCPENTNIAYQTSIQHGVPIVEMDLRLTSDGVLILSHDATFDRCTDGKGPVVEKSMAEVEKLDAGSWKSEKFKGEPVPKVETIANTCRDKAVMMLDLKCTGLGKSLAELKQKLNFPSDQWILAPWEDAEGVALRQYIKDVPMIRLTGKVPTDNFDDAYFAKMKQIGFSGFSVQWANLTQAFIDAAHAHDFKIYCWTVNDTPEIAGAVLAGVDGIITDDAPTTMKTVANLTQSK